MPGQLRSEEDNRPTEAANEGQDLLTRFLPRPTTRRRPGLLPGGLPARALPPVGREFVRRNEGVALG